MCPAQPTGVTDAGEPLVEKPRVCSALRHSVVAGTGFGLLQHEQPVPLTYAAQPRHIGRLAEAVDGDDRRGPRVDGGGHGLGCEAVGHRVYVGEDRDAPLLRTTASAVSMFPKAGTMTSSPAPMPAARQQLQQVPMTKQGVRGT